MSEFEFYSVRNTDTLKKVEEILVFVFKTLVNGKV